MQQQLFSNRSKQRQREQSVKKGRKSKVTEAIKDKIIEKLNGKWSPEQIAATVLNGIVSFKTIYNWLDSGSIKFDKSKLRIKGKSRQRKETRGRFNIGTSISKRPKTVKSRQEFGHWELDTVVSSRGKSKGCLTTFVEIKSRFYVALPMKNRTKRSMFSAIKNDTPFAEGCSKEFLI